MIFAQLIYSFVQNEQNFVFIGAELLFGGLWINNIHQ